MKELPKSRLTFKESMIESQYLATKTKEEKNNTSNYLLKTKEKF